MHLVILEMDHVMSMPPLQCTCVYIVIHFQAFYMILQSSNDSESH